MPVIKIVEDVNGGAVLPGDELEYTIALKNFGNDDAVNLVLTDEIPDGTTYVPGSMQITAAPPLAFTGTLTDAADNDVAEFIGTSPDNRVVFRLGTGATASSGGTLALDESTTVKFRVEVGPAAMFDERIINTAVATYEGATLGTLFTSSGTKDVVVGQGGTTLDLIKSAQPQPTIQAGQLLTYTFAVTNAGANIAVRVRVEDVTPPGTTFVSARALDGWTITQQPPEGGGTNHLRETPCAS